MTDDKEMMTRILSNLPEEYEKIVENLEEELGEDINPLTTKNICDKFLGKYYQITVIFLKNLKRR